MKTCILLTPPLLTPLAVRVLVAVAVRQGRDRHSRHWLGKDARIPCARASEAGSHAAGEQVQRLWKGTHPTAQSAHNRSHKVVQILAKKSY